MASLLSVSSHYHGRVALSQDEIDVKDRGKLCCSFEGVFGIPSAMSKPFVSED